MKKIVLLFTALFLVLVSCKENGVPKPKNLIDRNQMVDIIYDLAILESARSQSMVANSFPKSNDFIKEKYKIDSLTFAQNTKYYASDVKEYKKMYEEVKQRIIDQMPKTSEKKEVLPEDAGIIK